MSQVPIKHDQYHNLVQGTYGDKAFRGDYDVNDNLIYAGFAIPGSSTGDRVWQIKKLTYTDNNLVSITWPEISSKASTSYSFEWDDRTLYTYS